MAPLTRLALAAALVAALGSAGCASFLRPEGPRTLAPDTGAVHLGTSVYSKDREDGNGFNLDLMYRRGVASRVDMGGRLNHFGVAGDVKVQLVRASEPRRGVDVAVAPSIGYGADITWTSSNEDSPDWDLQVGLPLIVGINIGDYQLVVSPQLLYQHVDALPSGVLNAGGTVAFGRVGGDGFSLYPALAIWKSLDARHPWTSLRGPGPVVLQPALILRWGP
jgi:hypothetical protein